MPWTLQPHLAHLYIYKFYDDRVFRCVFTHYVMRNIITPCVLFRNYFSDTNFSSTNYTYKEKQLTSLSTCFVTQAQYEILFQMPSLSSLYEQ